MTTISVKSLSDLPAATKAILKYSGDKKIFCFYGNLGAGKTTLIKEICKQLGVKEACSSPTFSLVNEYDTISGKKIYHFDLYRLKNQAELYDIGYEDYIFSGNHCFIEWPEKIEGLLPEDHLKVSIETSGEERIIRIS